MVFHPPSTSPNPDYLVLCCSTIVQPRRSSAVAQTEVTWRVGSGIKLHPPPQHNVQTPIECGCTELCMYVTVCAVLCAAVL